MIIGIIILLWGITTIFLSYNSVYVEFIASIINAFSGIGAMGSMDYFSKKNKSFLAKILIRVFSIFFIIIGSFIILLFYLNIIP